MTNVNGSAVRTKLGDTQALQHAFGTYDVGTVGARSCCCDGENTELTFSIGPELVSWRLPGGGMVIRSGNGSGADRMVKSATTDLNERVRNAIVNLLVNGDVGDHERDSAAVQDSVPVLTEQVSISEFHTLQHTVHYAENDDKHGKASVVCQITLVVLKSFLPMTTTVEGVLVRSIDGPDPHGCMVRVGEQFAVSIDFDRGGGCMNQPEPGTVRSSLKL